MTGAAGEFYWALWLLMRVPGWYRWLVLGVGLVGAFTGLVVSAYIDARHRHYARELRRQQDRRKRLDPGYRLVGVHRTPEGTNCSHWIPEGF